MVVMLLDVSQEPGLPHFSAAKGGGLRCYPEPRQMDEVRLVVLHQWGAHAELRPHAGESVATCAIRRARSVPYHISVFEDMVVWAWSAAIVSWCSNGFNRSSISIGVGGRFPELESRRTGAHSVVAPFEDTLDEALAAVAERLPGRTLVTHRQASRHRRADPGEALAQRGAHTWRELGLEVDYTWTIGSGAAAPTCWSQG